MDIWNVILENKVVLLVVLIGIIQAFSHLVIKRQKITREEWWIFLFSLLVGLAAGFSYQLAYFGLPEDGLGWFNLVMFGLGLGVIMPWIYKAGQNIMAEAGKEMAKRLRVTLGLPEDTDDSEERTGSSPVPTPDLDSDES